MAMAFYFQSYLQTPKETPDFIRTISDDYMAGRESFASSKLLDTAVSAMALGTFAKTHRHPEAAAQASKAYEQVLRHVQPAIQRLELMDVDVCLLAIFFMSRYEDLVHHRTVSAFKGCMSSDLPSYSHHDGASAVLKVWKDRFSHAHPPTNVIKRTRRGILRSALLRTRTLPEWMHDGSAFGECGLSLLYDRIMVRILDLRQGPHAATFSGEMNVEIRDLHHALEEWKSAFPPKWNFSRHNVPHEFKIDCPDFYSRTVFGYASPTYAAVWAKYYATELLIQNLRISPGRISGRADQSSDDVLRLDSFANDLASTVPFCLERFQVHHSSPDTITLSTKDARPYNATLIAWPLAIASGIGRLKPEQRSWFRSALSRIGRAIGVGVFECAETDEWIDL